MLTQTNILDLIQHETGLQFRHATKDEWHGQCPWCGGYDRFHLWTEAGRWHCMGRSVGRSGCDKHGDAIEFVKLHKGMQFREAAAYLGVETTTTFTTTTTVTTTTTTTTEPQNPPARAWSEPGWTFVLECHQRLMDTQEGTRALAWLHKRGLTDAIMRRAGLGYNPADTWVDRAAWGLPLEAGKGGRPKALWLPRGIVIPWVIGGDLWGVNIRRPIGEPKYYWVPGGVRGLYGADDVAMRPAVLTEGEIDALTITQEAGDLVAAVATGSTAGARRARWIARLATPDCVLVAYDTDEAGDKAAAYWIAALPTARRWRPYWKDANTMLQDGANVRAWVAAGLIQGDTCHTNGLL